MTSPNRDWALIIHADSSDTRVDVYWVDINAGREGLRLAKQVKEWRQRSDLLTIGQRFRVIEGPPDNYGDQQTEADEALAAATDSPAAPDVPPDVPQVPQDPRRNESRREYLQGRVRALVASSDAAAFALQRQWPTDVPGLKREGHTWEQLEAITAQVENVEQVYQLPFYPMWQDPHEEAKRVHPSNRWARPTVERDDTPEGEEMRLSIQEALSQHPRRALLQSWLADAIAGGINHDIDTTALAHALYEFAKVDERTWPDGELTVMLEACLHTLGYVNGTRDLGKFNPKDAPLLMSAAFAVAAGTVAIIYNDDGSTEMLTEVTTRETYL